MQEDKGYVVLCRIVDRKEECVEKVAERIRLGERNKYLIRCYFSEDYLGDYVVCLSSSTICQHNSDNPTGREAFTVLDEKTDGYYAIVTIFYNRILRNEIRICEELEESLLERGMAGMSLVPADPACRSR